MALGALDLGFCNAPVHLEYKYIFNNPSGLYNSKMINNLLRRLQVQDAGFKARECGRCALTCGKERSSSPHILRIKTTSLCLISRFLPF